MGYKHKDLIGTRELSKEEILYFLEAAKEFKELNLSQVKKMTTFVERPRSTHFMKTRQELEHPLRSQQRGLELIR